MLDREGKYTERFPIKTCVAPGKLEINGEPATAILVRVMALLFLSPLKFQELDPLRPMLIDVTVESNRFVVKFPTANCALTSVVLIVSCAKAGAKIAAATHMIAMPAISRFMYPP